MRHSYDEFGKGSLDSLDWENKSCPDLCVKSLLLWNCGCVGEGIRGVKLCCWIALVEWSQLIRPTDGCLVPLNVREGERGKTKLGRGWLSTAYVSVSEWVCTVCKGSLGRVEWVCVHKYACLLLLWRSVQAAIKYVNACISPHGSICSAPSCPPTVQVARYQRRVWSLNSC